LKIELERVGKENPGLVSNVRGYGLHLGFDSNRAESLSRWLYRTGFQLDRVGPNTFGLRPAINLNIREAS
jgi:acetylornithine/succinyldiaminopimelate/putrescine aminotransferase